MASSDENPPSSKRQKVNAEKSAPPPPPLNSGVFGRNNAPIARDSPPAAVDNSRSSTFPLSIRQTQNPIPEPNFLWCRLLSQKKQITDVSIFSSGHTFSVGDQMICRFKRTQQGGNVIAMLESAGSVLVNGTATEKNKSCMLKSGDEVVLPDVNAAFIFQQLIFEVAVRNTEVHSPFQKISKPERKSGDPSGSNSKQAFDKRLEPMRSSQPTLISSTSQQCAAFKEDTRAGILDGRNLEVSFDSFPYYLSESAKDMLIAASNIRFKHREYTSDLTVLHPRISLSGPAGSEIYQEKLVKALAHHFGAKLLTFDGHLFLDSIKKAELLNSSQQPSLPADLSKNLDPLGLTDSSSTLNAPSLCGPESHPKMEANTLSSSGSSKSQLFNIGDRVKYAAPSPTSPSRGPASGARGEVVLLFQKNSLAKIGVRFDKPIPDGVDLGGLGEGNHGYFCSGSDLKLENSGRVELEKLLIGTLFEVIQSESKNSPFILFLKDVEKSIIGNTDWYSTFKSKLPNLPDNVIAIGSHTHTDILVEKVNNFSFPLGFTYLGCFMLFFSYHCPNMYLRWIRNLLKLTTKVSSVYTIKISVIKHVLFVFVPRGVICGYDVCGLLDS